MAPVRSESFGKHSRMNLFVVSQGDPLGFVTRGTTKSLVTWSKMATGELSATADAISMPRFSGSGCMTMPSGLVSLSRSKVRPHNLAYSRTLGSKACPNPSRCHPCIIITSAPIKAFKGVQFFGAKPFHKKREHGRGATTLSSSPNLVKAAILDRATRLCETSPTITTVNP